MNAELQRIIDESYALFGRYTVSNPLDVCTVCCVNPEEMRGLLNPRVREISSELIGVWNHAAKTDCPDLAEFKHFLPRILDLVSQFQFSPLGAELSLKSFKYYEEQDWLPAERKLIDQFARAYFRHCLAQNPVPDIESLGDILIMFWPTPCEVPRLLEEWEQSSWPSATCHLADFVTREFEQKHELHFANPFADETLGSILVDWITDEKVVLNFSEKLEGLVLGDAEPEYMDRSDLSIAYDSLLWLGTKFE